MDSKVIKQIFSDSLDTIFSYSYSLVPDELLAQQLAIDSFTQLLCSKLEQLRGKSDFEQELFKVMFSLAKRRSTHLSSHENWSSDDRSYFYRLDLEDRAILFLKERLLLSYHQVSFIVDKDLDFIQAQHLQIQLKLHEITTTKMKTREVAYGA